MKKFLAVVASIVVGVLILIGVINAPWITFGAVVGFLALVFSVYLLIVLGLAPNFRIWGNVTEKYGLAIVRNRELRKFILPNGMALDGDDKVQEIQRKKRLFGGLRLLGNFFLHDTVWRYEDAWHAVLRELDEEVGQDGAVDKGLRPDIPFGPEAKKFVDHAAEDKDGFKCTIVATIPMKIVNPMKALFSGQKFREQQKIVAAALLGAIRASVRDYSVVSGDQGKKDVTLALKGRIQPLVNDIMELTGIEILSAKIEVLNIDPPAEYRAKIVEVKVAEIEGKAKVTRENLPLLSLLDAVEQRFGKTVAAEALRLKLLKDVPAEINGASILLERSPGELTKKLVTP